MNKAFLLFCGVALSVSSVLADERILSEKELLTLGLKPVARVRVNKKTLTDPERGAPWPVTFKSQAASIAQNYVQYQNYGTGQYYHGGCDLRAEPYSEMRAPVSGKLEAGYYGYKTESDGSDTKWWKAWDGKPTDSLYFEVAVVTDTGYRYEMHHVNPKTLPGDIVSLLNAGIKNPGSVRVEAGRLLAYVSKWSSEYDHVHYNIVRADGVRMNPEQFSVEVTDTQAPKILETYAIDSKGKGVPLVEGASVPKTSNELVVLTTESRDGNQYVQTPTYLSVVFESGEASGWDFRTWLADANGKWVDIRNFFIPSLRTTTRKTVSTYGNYGEGQFLIRLPLPLNATGRFQLIVGDTAGNQTVMNLVRD